MHLPKPNVAVSSPRTTPTRSSGASLALVLLAIVLTAGYGALMKKGERDAEGKGLRAPVKNFQLVQVDSGMDLAPAPLSPPAAMWLKMELYGDGKPIHYRPIQFKKRCVDATGKPMTVDHVWSDGFLYLLIRKGYRKASGPLTLDLTFQGHTCYRGTVAGLPQSKRGIRADARVPFPFGLTPEVVKLPNRDQSVRLGLRLKGRNLSANDAYVVERRETSFADDEPYRKPVYALFGVNPSLGPVPLDMAYPEDADAAKLHVIKLRSHRFRQTLKFDMVYLGHVTGGHLFQLDPDLKDWAGGVYVSISRYNRALVVADNGLQPLPLQFNGVRVLQSAAIRLISPASIHGVPLMTVNRMLTPNPPHDPVSKPVGDAKPGLDERVTITVEAEVVEYLPVAERDYVLPINAAKAPPAKLPNHPTMFYIPRA